MTKQTKTILAGLTMMTTLLSISIIYNIAFTQESDLRVNRQPSGS